MPQADRCSSKISKLDQASLGDGKLMIRKEVSETTGTPSNAVDRKALETFLLAARSLPQCPKWTKRRTMASPLEIGDKRG